MSDGGTSCVKGDLWCAGTTTWSTDDSANASANHCWTTGSSCSIEVSTSDSGFAFYGVIDDKSGTYGCRLDQYDTQWFQVSPDNVGKNTYLCWIAGMSSGSHTLQVWNGYPNQYLGLSTYTSKSATPKGDKGDGKTWYADGASSMDSGEAPKTTSTASKITTTSTSTSSSASSTSTSGSSSSSTGNLLGAMNSLLTASTTSTSRSASSASATNAGGDNTLGNYFGSATMITIIGLAIALSLSGCLVGWFCCRRATGEDGQPDGEYQDLPFPSESDKRKHRKHHDSKGSLSDDLKEKEQNIGIGRSSRRQRQRQARAYREYRSSDDDEVDLLPGAGLEKWDDTRFSRQFWN
ncbi:hypothetical protein T439DRAFT_358948 [Meredithblackwellia eburnea MCA 4105]